MCHKHSNNLLMFCFLIFFFTVSSIEHVRAHTKKIERNETYVNSSENQNDNDNTNDAFPYSCCIVYFLYLFR